MARTQKILWIATALCVLTLSISSLPAIAQRAVGACCMSDGSCSITSEALCNEKGGDFLGLNTTCDDCPPICEDGDPCTEDTWTGRQCVYEPLDCDDGNPCTVDSCFMGRCSHAPITCDDDNPCTTDSCVGGNCVNEPLDCDDGDPCTSDLCYMGECGHEEIPCNDGNPCTTDACVGGDCVYEPISCDDGNACTEDSCVDGDCVYEAVRCSDGDPCTTDACIDGNCIYEPMDCSDGDPCTTDRCAAGQCTHEGIDCDDGNDRTTDTCNEGVCEHTLIKTPESHNTGETRPVIWLIDEAPWGEFEIQLHKALCAAAARAGAKLRSLLYRDQEANSIEELLNRLSPDRRPDLILCSQETIQQLNPITAGEIRFFDTSSLQTLLAGNSEPTIVGLPGLRMDWTPFEAAGDSADGIADPTQLPDPLEWISQLAALKRRGDGSGEPSSEGQILATLNLPSGPCHIVFTPLAVAAENGSGPIRLCCAQDCEETDAGFQVIAPQPHPSIPSESYGVGIEPDSTNRLALWFARIHGLDPAQDETWQRIASGHPLLDGEPSVVDAFRQWLTAIGLGEAAEQIAQQAPLPEDSYGIGLRFLWFRQQLEGIGPENVPWWQRWIQHAADQANAESVIQTSPLFVVLAQIDSNTGQLRIDLLEP